MSSLPYIREPMPHRASSNSVLTLGRTASYRSLAPSYRSASPLIQQPHLAHDNNPVISDVWVPPDINRLGTPSRSPLPEMRPFDGIAVEEDEPPRRLTKTCGFIIMLSMGLTIIATAGAIAWFAVTRKRE